MTKHRKHRRTRKGQRGGAWYDALNPFGSSEIAPPTVEEPGMLSNITDSVSGTLTGAVSSTEGFLQGAKEKSTSWFSSLNPFSSKDVVDTQTTVYNPEQSVITGGKHRRKTRKMRVGRYMKGGKGDSGLTYYATPVYGLKVVQPTYWIKGGSKRRKTRRNKKR